MLVNANMYIMVGICILFTLYKA